MGLVPAVVHTGVPEAKQEVLPGNLADTVRDLDAGDGGGGGGGGGRETTV